MNIPARNIKIILRLCYENVIVNIKKRIKSDKIAIITYGNDKILVDIDGKNEASLESVGNLNPRLCRESY